jgi:hypothetical protein
MWLVRIDPRPVKEEQVMFTRVRIRTLAILTTVFILLISSYAPAWQDKPKKEAALGTPLLWREPVDIASRNLYLGPGGEALKPNLSKVVLVEEKESGADSLKFRVRDGSNREWVVKVGGEARAETAAGRLVWAAGYYTDISYLAPRVEIESKGVFENARFEARSKGVKRLDEWLWDDNPFVGTQELQGLKVLLALLDNWNLKNENNKILYVRDDEAGGSELRYIISDLDTKLDKTGKVSGLWARSKDEGILKIRLIDRVKDGLVQFDYGGRHKERLSDITVGQARWIGGWLAKLSDQQVIDACRAGNYSPEESRTLAAAVRARINELINLPK